MANPKITIQVIRNFLTGQEEIKIDHENIPTGWPVVAHIMVKAQEAAMLQAFQQLMASQEKAVVVANKMPDKRLILP